MTNKDNKLIIKGAKENNLKNIDLEIPRDKLVVFTGVSGSGKTSLAFDTIYAEGQRRYVESLSAYARMFLGQMEKPDVEFIEGLSPAISIDQKTTNKNPRSTVGTVTEIYDYLRLLFARVGIPHCPKCGREIKQQSVDQIVDQILSLDEGSRLHILAPVIRAKKGEHVKIFEDAKKSGYVRVRVDGHLYELTEDISLEKNKRHNIEIVIDRLVVRPDIRKRLTDSIELALHLSDGTVIVLNGEEELTFSQNYACPDCGISIDELSPRTFSFNSPFGACPQCGGIGSLKRVDPELVIISDELSVLEGAFAVSGWRAADKEDSIANAYYRAMAKKYNFRLDVPVKTLPKEIINLFLFGTKGEPLDLEFYRNGKIHRQRAPFEGLVNNLQRRYEQTDSMWSKMDIEPLMRESECHVCHGKRLKKESLAVTVGGKNIDEVCSLDVTQALKFFNGLKFGKNDAIIAEQILKEINARLGFLKNVGLDYLTLSRSAGTLSGGEAQRIRLATQIGSGLVGVLYILDEPSIGLHQRDNNKLLDALKNLRDMGNTLIVVEHDEDTMYAADYIVDVGPGAGIHGGEIVAAGTVEDIKNTPASITGDYLSGRRHIDVPKERRPLTGRWLTVHGAAENNLKNLEVSIPLGQFVCVTGVSGSGKSSLVNEIISKRLSRDLNHSHVIPGRHGGIDGVEHLDKVINIDQSPIGRTPRSNPATYTGVFGDIREIFAATNEAKARGYGSGRFSFNVRGGRCEACSGDGIIKIEMHFLPDVYVPCEVCKGKRYNRETLEVRFKGKNIYEVLDMTVEEALEFFDNIPRIRRKIQTLYDVGLGYIKLGQSSTTLSGGEAQRVKLATELSRRSTGRTIYILDEPTTGLHVSDVHKLIDVLQCLVDTGNTVVVIEHNLDVIKTADYIIDLGPEGGDRGGEIVAAGTPEEVAACEGSYTGQFLKKIL